MHGYAAASRQRTTRPDDIPLRRYENERHDEGRALSTAYRSLHPLFFIVLTFVTFSFFFLVTWVASSAATWSIASHEETDQGQFSSKEVYTIKDFKDHVSFGDSYSSERYVNDSNTASGGHTWDRFVANYVGDNLHDFAVGGAICSDVYWPSYSTARDRQLEDQIPRWLGNDDATNLDAETTVYSNWIGTNDLGVDGFLLGGEPPGTNITTFIECNFQLWDMVYANGGRYFVTLNQAPLQYTPLYAAIGEGGVGDCHYWPNKTSYDTYEESRHMIGNTLLVNEAYAFGLPYQLLIAKRWPGATIALFDVHTLLTEIYDNPAAHLESPANSTGSWQHCGPEDPPVCVDSTESKASFEWFDELHPSERTDEIIARAFIDVVVHGNSSYATYWKSER